MINWYVSIPTIVKLKQIHQQQTQQEKERIKKRWAFAPGWDAWTVDFTCILKTDHFKLQLLTVSDPLHIYVDTTNKLFVRSDGLITYRIKKPYRDGTEWLLFSPMELLEKLSALVPQPRFHTVHYHGVFAPHAKARSKIVLGKQQIPFPFPKKHSQKLANFSNSLLQGPARRALR